jgi:hypothetical protein
MSPNDIRASSKVPTVLYYDNEYKNVQSWGVSESEGKPVELFKLLLGKMENELPLQYEKAIVDYLRELGKVVKQTIQGVDFYTQALIVLAVNKF